MNQRNQALVLMWAAVFLMCGSGTRVVRVGVEPNELKILKPANKGRRLPVFAPQVGTGPVCIPGIPGCES